MATISQAEFHSAHPATSWFSAHLDRVSGFPASALLESPESLQRQLEFLQERLDRLTPDQRATLLHRYCRQCALPKFGFRACECQPTGV